MSPFYHAYQSYEHQVILGIFDPPESSAVQKEKIAAIKLMAALGDGFIQMGQSLRRPLEVQQLQGGTPALGKLNR